MQIEIKIDSAQREPKIVITTDKMSDEISEIVKKLSDDMPFMLAGFHDDSLEILEQNDIVRIYAQDGKSLAVTLKGEYVVRLRLYELAERLDKSIFVRISNSEIINLKKVKNFDLSFTGTICVSLSNGAVTYVSRRYVAKIKQILGI